MNPGDLDSYDRQMYDQLTAEHRAHTAAGRWDQADEVHRYRLMLLHPDEAHKYDPHPAKAPEPEPNRNLSGPQFFHGTNVDLRPRSLIRPASQTGHQREYYGYGNEDYAFATTRMTTASVYARDRTAARGGTERVYQVEPTGEHEEDPKQQYGYRSRSPYRVIRRVPRSEFNAYGA